MVGRDGVSLWIAGETEVALIRHFGPHADYWRLPIFPILPGVTRPDRLPAFLQLFQATPWGGEEPLPEYVLEQIHDRRLRAGEEVCFEGCSHVALDAFSIDQANLFFGRQKETLEALAWFDMRANARPVRWLEINGNSDSGKSSLMNAGLLPLIEQGWLWPRTRSAHWLRIGPMMPGEKPVEMLAESLSRFSGDALKERVEMADVRDRPKAGDFGLTDWLRTRKRRHTAFLLTIDKFEELFTFADPEERTSFDGLLATALDNKDRPLFIISTVRADFLNRYGEDLPRFTHAGNRHGKSWRLPPIDTDGLHEAIDGPARLAGLDVSEVRAAILGDAGNEPGALPPVENMLHGAKKAVQWSH